jgi:hypothetical protein
MRALSWLYDLFVHHHAENLRTQRAVARKGLGVDTTDLPYPGSVAGSGNQSTTTNTIGGKGWLLGPLLGVALAAAGAGGAYLLTGSQSAPPDKSQPMDPGLIRSPGYEWDEIEQELQPDGTWKATGVSVRKRMGADGIAQTRQPDGTWK